MSTESAVAAAIEALVTSVNGGDVSAALSAFANDAVIIEDIPPYRWTGVTAPAAWLAGMAENATKLGVTDIWMEVQEPSRIEVDESRAYAVLPGLLRLTTRGPEVTADGLLTFTLVQDSDRWLIDTLVWSGRRPE